MKREKELVKNTFIISLGTFLPKLTSIITLPILTAYLTKAEYGIYDLITTLISLVLPIATLKIDSAAFRFLIDCRDNEKEKKEIISTIYLFIIAVTFITTIILSFFIKNVSIFTKIIILIYFIVDIINVTTLQIIRGINKNLLYSISCIINTFINMTLIIILVYFEKKGLNGLLISLLLALLISTIILIIRGNVVKAISINCFSKKKLKELLSYSWPMVPNTLSLWVMNLSDRLIITSFMGIEANAIYAVANKIPTLFNTFQSTFTSAWQENASITKNDDDVDNYYSNIFDTVFCMITGLMGLLIGISPILFTILIHGDYDLAYYQMPFLFAGMLFSAISSFLGGIYVAHKKTKSIGITTIIVAGINFLINIVFIKKIGIYAASISTFISFLILTIFRMINVQKFQKIKFKYNKISLYLFILFLMSLILYYNKTYTNILNLLLGFTFAFIINRNVIKVIFVNIRKKLKRGK